MEICLLIQASVWTIFNLAIRLITIYYHFRELRCAKADAIYQQQFYKSLGAYLYDRYSDKLNSW